ncbi:PREDICTED: uncharacterized protein LOC108770499 [Trachymyrmex cornetzi]|uniref:uncharacterized protein LOC108770499 n=1 Tax=Trachymyrmex cornetzi TaxID=471704 RepID=UPI00084F6D16|nr:PREDICTED: uncharacterized protein LOC108770499 [Trachymyrmex cornetzi]
MYPSTNFVLRGFHVIRADISNSGMRGICILIRNNIVFSTIDSSHLQHEDVELQAIKVISDDDSIAIMNVYCHPNRRISPHFYADFLQFGEAQKNCILVGDFNAHHSAWGCSTTDKAGRSLLDAVEGINGCIMSDEKPTLLLPPGSRTSVIDITTSGVAPLCEVCTNDDTYGSDHYPVTTKGRSLNSKKRYLYRIRLDSKELIEFQKALDATAESFLSSLGDNECENYTKLTNHLVSLASECSNSKHKEPRTISQPNGRASPPWWTEACQRAVVIRREAAKRWQRKSTIESFMAFKKARAKCSKVLYKEKKKGWRRISPEV